MLKRAGSNFRSKVSGRMMFIYAVVLIAFFGISTTDRAHAVNLYVETFTKTWGTIECTNLYVITKILEVKQLIANKTGFPVEQQHLYFQYNGKELDNNTKIVDYKDQIRKSKYTLFLEVDESYPPGQEPAVESVYEEPVFYALPEDEIGAYAIRQDGTKEYLLFHTYDICMDWLASDELCAGFERCFHKDGK